MKKKLAGRKATSSLVNFRPVVFMATALLVVLAVLFSSVSALAAASVVTTIPVGGWPIGVGVNPTTDKIYVANSTDNTVSVIDGTNDTVTGSPITVGRTPWAVGVNPVADKIYVANWGDNTVSVIDGATDTVTGSPITVGTKPYAVGVNPTTNKIYVANWGDNTVSVIDGATDSVTGVLTVGTNPWGVGVNPTTNKIYVANWGDNTVSVIEGATDTVTGSPITVGTTPYGVGVNPTTDKIYVANAESNTVSVLYDPSVTPTTTALSPDHKTVGDAGFTLTVNGTGFITSSVIRWQGADCTTTYVSDTQLTASIPATDIQTAGTAQVTVLTPGAGESNAQTFTINLVTFYFAEGTCRPGFDPYICVQNPSGTDAQVKITYMLGDASTDSQTFTVTKQSRMTIPVSAKLGVADDAAHDFSAKVESLTAGADIICERPMYFNYNGWTGGSCVIGASGPSSSWYFAEGTCRPGFDPYICVQNPSGTDAQVKITYMLGDASTDSQTFTVTKQSRMTIPVSAKLGVADDAAHDFSAKVESLTAGADIICERPMYFNYNGWTGGHAVVGHTP